jgi:hypothetical protein
VAGVGRGYVHGRPVFLWVNVDVNLGFPPQGPVKQAVKIL